MSSKASPSLLSITAFFIILFFLYSTASYPATSSSTTRSDNVLLASKALLHKHDINAYLTPHIHNIFVDKDYQFTELVQGDSEAAEACLERAKQFCWTDTLHVARVTFRETDANWTLCHCAQFPNHARLPKGGVCDPEPWSYLLSHLSRVPTSLRERIYTIMLVPVSRSPLANPVKPSPSSNISQREKQTAALPHGMFTSSPSLAMFFGYPGIGTWIHEFTHSADYHNHDGMFSSSSLWTRALEKDTCISDGYARTSRAEALAQAAIVKSYLDSRSLLPISRSRERLGDEFPALLLDDAREQFDPLLGDYSCMKRQLLAIECLNAAYSSAGLPKKCIEPQDLGQDALGEESRDLILRHGTWWEMWLVTDMLIILIMLAQL